MRPSQLLAAAVTLSSLSAAWPWPPSFKGIDAVGLVGEHLFRRADSTNTKDASATKSAKDTAAESTAAAATTAAKSTAETTAAATTGSAASAADSTASKTGTATGTKTGSKKTTTGTGTQTGTGTGTGTAAATTSYSFTGGVTMITPNALSGSQYYKIGDWVTFAWNYTSLSVTPTGINVLASCSLNSATYTIALNQSVHATNKVLWDTGAYQSTATIPLLTESYTLIIYDAASEVSATAEAGHLGAYSQYYFGMYTPKPYTPYSEYNCPTCSGGMTSAERQTLSFLFGMAAITVLSFTWFAGNVFGVL